MVDAPKCKVCGTAHFGSAHVWPPSVTKLAKSTVGTGRVVHRAGMNTTGDVFRPVVAKKPAFDRVAYQREYMRKRRAKK